MNNIFAKLDNVSFTFLRDINIKDAFYLCSIMKYKEVVSLTKSLWEICISIMSSFSENYVQQINNNKCLLVYGEWGFLKESYEKALKVKNACENLDCILAKDYPNVFKLRLFPMITRTLKSAYLCLCWFFNLLGVKASLNEKLLLINEILKLYFFLNKFKCVDKYKLVTVYYDVSPYENALVQRCVKKGIKTATLQHGVWMNQDKKRLVNGYTDYYLAWDEFSKNLAIKYGVPEQSIKVLGIPMFIDADEKPYIHNSKKCCVFLDSDEYSDGLNPYNIKAINILKKFAQENGFKVLIKLRRGEHAQQYSEYADDIATITDGTNIADIARECEFSVVITSSAFAELCYMKLPVLRMIGNFDTFEDIKNVAFETFEELNQIYFKEGYIQNCIQENFKIFGCENSRDKYREFFESFNN